jgi:hypothetical protein
VIGVDLVPKRVARARSHGAEALDLRDVSDGDVLGVDDVATHRLALEEAPAAYEMFQKKDDAAIKVLFQPA